MDTPSETNADNECDSLNSENELFRDLGDVIEAIEEPLKKRDLCKKCCRPITVCWCPYLPLEPLNVKTAIHIFQHPFEEARSLKTAPMLYYGLGPKKCHIHVGKKFPINKYPELEQVISSPNTLLLFPGPNAVDIKDIEPRDGSVAYNLLLIDGTWTQAKGMYRHNEIFQNLRQVQLSETGVSEYVIRTQPTDGSLSTLETAAVTISILEGRPEIKEILVRPLKALCDFQLQCGAAKHHSKQYLIENGLYTKKLPKKFYKKQAKNLTCEDDS
ncbi:DTW domain-containing protein 2 isoform X2 [Lingula anatina]|uniref:tRNA-uridine aminocarboxypropyltransferase n=1 Tax=Lingula anatina TaxID=7574 RepID=A0A1S3IA60_LINAN|nr:DTW domain-containing protein 2 isoform X1 [Lingula anatina]XP_013394747.1 DTW domain-containing protein 2 isoform X2 [Lingula anatina]|eukprot:XP_013394746.1 DTW domain-containing protein 2 isoform X1 [Lingula anatina]